MNLLKTDRTYATYANALKALETACVKIGTKLEEVRFVIAVNESGRFAPAVIGTNSHDRMPWNNLLFHKGISWMS